jgi:FdhD protein
MRTPGQDFELAAGFLFTEGILRRPDQIAQMRTEPPDAEDGNVVRIELKPGVAVDWQRLERHFYTSSSCGVCGKTSIEALRMTGLGSKPVFEGARPVVDAATIHDLPKRLRGAQSVFEITGGLHAAALFEPDGRLVALREDVGRHNAVDKLIGSQWLTGRTPLLETILFVSGRASFELMQKALMAGIPMLVAVGAPSSLAVALAEEFGATLIGFTRDQRFNIYAGAERIREAAPVPAR